MRSAVYHPAHTRTGHPAASICATCGGRAIFTDRGRAICGTCFDKVIAADDAAREARKA